MSSGPRASRSPVVMIGAGPYGLAAAAHLRARGVEVHHFGRVMSFWREHMPKGMYLRSSWDASHIGEPRGLSSLASFEVASGQILARPIPLADFIAYGDWFLESARGQIDEREVASVESDGDGFRVTVADGDVLLARRVVVATGIGSFAWTPPELAVLPRDLATHSSDHADLGRFRDRRVAIVGGGQSAVESAALLADAGARVDVLVRSGGLRWVQRKSRLERRSGPFRPLLFPRTDVGPIGLSLIVAHPTVFARIPPVLRERMAARAIRPAATRWLFERTREVTFTTGVRVRFAKAVGTQIDLDLDDGTIRRVDHVICATGYRVNVAAYPFIGPTLAARIAARAGAPLLRSGFESSVRGLHFLGAPSTYAYGPLMRFVAGTAFAAEELCRAIAVADRSLDRDLVSVEARRAGASR